MCFIEFIVSDISSELVLGNEQVLNAFNTLAESEVLRPFMRKALMEIAEASVTFQGKDCAPKSAGACAAISMSRGSTSKS